MTTDLCEWCHEAINPLGIAIRLKNSGFLHKACLFRQALGSVAHIEGRCSCYVPGSTEGDPPGLTTREAAEAALRVYLQYVE